MSCIVDAAAVKVAILHALAIWQTFMPTIRGAEGFLEATHWWLAARQNTLLHNSAFLSNFFHNQVNNSFVASPTWTGNPMNQKRFRLFRKSSPYANFITASFLIYYFDSTILGYFYLISAIFGPKIAKNALAKSQ